MEKLSNIFTGPIFEHSEHFKFSVLNIIEAVIIVLFARFLIKFVRQFIRKVLKKREWFDEERSEIIYRFFRLLIIVLSIISIFSVLKLNVLVKKVLGYSLVDTAHFHFEIYNLLVIFLVLLFARYVIRLLLLLLKKALSSSAQIDQGKQYTIIQSVKYLLFVIAFVLALESTGANLEGIFLSFSALLLGVGFGLQTFFYDILSGFIILFEGAFKVGDVIELDGIIARVKRIDIRTSKVITRDGTVIIVPNRKLTSENLINWSIDQEVSRYNISVGVAYGSDTKLVRQILYDCTLKHADIEKTREILVRFDDFEESALLFNIFFWTKRNWDIEILKSDLRFAIDDAFRSNGIVIPYPQRVFHNAGNK